MAPLAPGLTMLLSLTCASAGLILIAFLGAAMLIGLTDDLVEWMREHQPRFAEWIDRSLWRIPRF